MAADDDEYMLKLDSDIELETIVRNDFDDLDDSLDISISMLSDPDISDTTCENEYNLQDTDKDFNLRWCGSENYESDLSAKSEDDSYCTTDQSFEDQSPKHDSEAYSSKDELEEKSTSNKDDSKEIYKDNISTTFFGKHLNCKELIIFCVDLSSDMEKVPFILNNKLEHTPLNMVKRAIEIFVHNKHFIDSKHSYALMMLAEKAEWICDLTDDPKEFMEALEDLTLTVDCDTCDLGSIVSLILGKYPFILSKECGLPDLQTVFRVILIYGRVNCIPKFFQISTREFFTEYAHIFLDILYLHEPASEENKVMEVYNHLLDIDDKGKSYVFEVGRSTTKLHNCMGKLLAHPLQRAPQVQTDYKFVNIIPAD